MTVIAFSDDDQHHELDARLPDLGRPGWWLTRTHFHEDRGTGPGFHRERRVARCLSGHRVYLKRNPHYPSPDREARDEHGYHWVHFPGEQDCAGTVPMSPSEGEEHKILKARAVVAFRNAGNDPVRTEVHGSGRAYRSDVQFQRPDGSRFALEIQVSGIDTVTARRRTHLTRADGIEPLWLTPREAEHWQRLVPSVRLIRPARGDTRPGRIEEIELFVTGIAEPHWERCDRGRHCWRRRLHDLDECPTHLRWRMTGDEDEQRIDDTTSRYVDTARMLGIDTFAARITRGELVIVHAARDDRRGLFPLISTPLARLAALDYNRELEVWRAQQHRRPRLGPAAPYCTQPGRAEPEEHETTPQGSATEPTGAYGVSTPGTTPPLDRYALARAMAIQHRRTVRVLDHPDRALEAGLRRADNAELLLVPTPAHRDRLVAAGLPADHVLIDPANLPPESANPPRPGAAVTGWSA